MSDVMKADLSRLDDVQRAQVEMQWREQQHENFVVDFPLSGMGDQLQGFEVHRGVWNPLITAARYHAGYLFANNARLFAGKDALDMGTGSGLMAVVMGLYGIECCVDASDVSQAAYENACANVEKFNLSDRVNVYRGDLFEGIDRTYDCIVFNQPFFEGVADPEDTISGSMLAPAELMQRFLREAPEHLSPDGVIVMPSYDLAGPTNNPAWQSGSYGFHWQTGFALESNSGIQKGLLAVHELRRRA